MSLRGDPAGRWSNRGHRLAGLVLVAWAMWTMVRLVVWDRSVTAYDDLERFAASGVGLVLSGLVLASLVYHGLNGLRIVVLEMSPASQRLRRSTRLAVAFLTPALLLPGLVLLARPWITDQLG